MPVPQSWEEPHTLKSECHPKKNITTQQFLSFLRTQESPTKLAVTGFAPTGRFFILSHVVTDIPSRWGVEL